MYGKNAHLKLTNTYLYKRMLNIPRIVLLFMCVFHRSFVGRDHYDAVTAAFAESE